VALENIHSCIFYNLSFSSYCISSERMPPACRHPWGGRAGDRDGLFAVVRGGRKRETMGINSSKRGSD